MAFQVGNAGAGFEFPEADDVALGGGEKLAVAGKVEKVGGGFDFEGGIGRIKVPDFDVIGACSGEKVAVRGKGEAGGEILETAQGAAGGGLGPAWTSAE